MVTPLLSPVYEFARTPGAFWSFYIMEQASSVIPSSRLSQVDNIIAKPPLLWFPITHKDNN